MTRFEMVAGDEPPTYNADVTLDVGADLVRVTLPVPRSPELDRAVGAAVDVIEDALAEQLRASLVEQGKRSEVRHASS